MEGGRVQGIAWAFIVAVAAVWLLIEDDDEYIEDEEELEKLINFMWFFG